jgi:pimeloyl-ACP methyl ester carboxylesterase
MTAGARSGTLGTTMLTRRRVVVSAVCLLAVCAAAIAVVLLTSSGDERSGLALRSCRVGDLPARCGMLRVAEDPARPSGRTIGLRVVVFPATGTDPRPDPLLWFAGWGGAGATDDAPVVMPALRRVNADRDVVFVDQRGTGSSRLTCDLPADVDRLSPAELTSAARRCAQRIGPGLRHYTTSVAVDDFDAVRAALGYDRVNLYGGSYGVTTGLAYLQRHEAHVRTATFDSGSLLDVRIFERAAPNAQRALDMLFARCAADTACRTAFPALRREFAAVQARLRRAPIAVGGRPPLTASAFASGIEELLATPGGKAQVPRVVHLVAVGELGAAARAVAPYASESSGELAYQLLIECNEPWASWRPAEVRRLAVGSFMAPSQRQNARRAAAVCRAFPKVAVPAAMAERVRSQVPVLFLTGAEDPADPPGNVAHARRELPNSRTVIFPASGHGQLGYLCTQNLIADFLAAGSAGALDVTCARTAVQQPFETVVP